MKMKKERRKKQQRNKMDRLKNWECKYEGKKGR